MSDTVLTALIGGLCALVPTVLGALLVYRRAVKVELAKNKEDSKTELIDKWREYSEKLEKVKAEAEAQIEELRQKKSEQDDTIEELKKTNREQGRRIEELEQMIALQARQLAEMERRLGNLEGDA